MAIARVSLDEIDCDKFIDCLYEDGGDYDDMEILIDCADRRCL